MRLLRPAQEVVLWDLGGRGRQGQVRAGGGGDGRCGQAGVGGPAEGVPCAFHGGDF